MRESLPGASRNPDNETFQTRPLSLWINSVVSRCSLVRCFAMQFLGVIAMQKFRIDPTIQTVPAFKLLNSLFQRVFLKTGSRPHPLCATAVEKVSQPGLTLLCLRGASRLMRTALRAELFVFPPSPSSLPHRPPSAVNGCAVQRFARPLRGDGGGLVWPSEGIGTGNIVRAAFGGVRFAPAARIEQGTWRRKKGRSSGSSQNDNRQHERREKERGFGGSKWIVQ